MKVVIRHKELKGVRIDTLRSSCHGNEVGHYIAQARRFTVAKQYQSSFFCFFLQSGLCHTLPDSVNGRPTDINFREEKYPVVNVVSVTGRGSHERSLDGADKTHNDCTNTGQVQGN